MASQNGFDLQPHIAAAPVGARTRLEGHVGELQLGPRHGAGVLGVRQPGGSAPMLRSARALIRKRSLPLKTPSPGEVNLLQTYSPCYPQKVEKLCF